MEIIAKLMRSLKYAFGLHSIEKLKQMINLANYLQLQQFVIKLFN